MLVLREKKEEAESAMSMIHDRLRILKSQKFVCEQAGSSISTAKNNKLDDLREVTHQLEILDSEMERAKLEVSQLTDEKK